MSKRVFLSVIAIFCAMLLQAQTSKVNVTIDGPGVVDEYLMVSDDGKKQVKLKAVPSKFLGNVTFDGWSGDATGIHEELTISADKAQNIHATFTYHRPVKKYPLINLKQSWADMGKPMYVEEPGIWESEGGTAGRGYCYLPVDYNRDGYIDYVDFPKKGGMGIDNHRENVRFRLGMPDGGWEEDPKNDNRILGTVYSIIVKYADFNNDGFPDFCSFSSGYDREGSTGDYPVVLMSSPDGVYTDLRFTDYNHGYFHGGTTGDFDNDGDIDALFWDMWHNGGENSLYLENDGKGNFKQREAREIIDLNSYLGSLPNFPIIGMDVEVLDLNNDGYNDLIMCGHDHVDETSGYVSMPIVLWGSSSGKFGGDNYTQLPPAPIGYGITVGFVFYDFNGDGIKEIIVNKNCDGIYGNSIFYIGNYFQVCELQGDHYVDKTSTYIPIQQEPFQKNASEIRTWIEEVDGIPYLCTGGQNDDHYLEGVGVGAQKLYALHNGIFEPIAGQTKTKIESYSEGIPVYVDGPRFTDLLIYDDGINPIDTMAEHHWVEYSQWDGTGSGNMWRINPHYRKDTHFGRTCIRWNRDGLDPKKKEQHENQTIGFHFVSDVNVKVLMYNDYYLEFYIKNSDPGLSLLINGITVDVNNTDEGKFTGEWQRMLCPLRDINRHNDIYNTIVFEVDEGDHDNEFYLDDIRIRRLTISESRDEYVRAFSKGFVDGSYAKKERTNQITSQEFKALLKPLVKKFAPTKMDYFNSRISDYDLPLTRNIAVGMAYYTAVCIGADTNNNMNESEQPEDFWAGCWEPEVSLVLPHANDEPTTPVGPDDNFWMEWQEIMQAVMWNSCHVSDFSNIEVIPRDKEANTYHWLNPFTWEDAICAITRLCDSIDPEAYVMKEISIGSKGKTTLTSSKALDFSDFEDLKAYVATGYESNGTIWLTRIKLVPANTPILIKGEADKTYDVPVLDKCEAYFENMFKGSADEEQVISTTTSDGKYKNFYMSGGQFKPASTSQKINAGKAYLQVPATFNAAKAGEDQTVKIADSGKSSYAPPVDVDLTNVEGLKAYAATGYDPTNSTIWLTRINKIQAGEGVMLKGEPNKEYTLPSTAAQAFYGNMFVGNTGEKITINETSDDGEWTNFYLASGLFKKVSKSREIGTNKSYLHLPTSLLVSNSNARGKQNAGIEEWLMEELETEVMYLGSIGGDDDGTTRIDAIRQENVQPNVYYNLQGQRVENPKKGLYIRNGKKVVIK